ncbi:MAG: 2-dehydropantoate 2-reductase [Dehalococcoidales bacterium]|nr:2-dehydropantoate 2-reductase [Dehalococcoidales bacterium]
MTGGCPEIKRVCVFGTGGVGGYFGGRIAEKIESTGLKDRKVYFIARGEHLAAIKNRGLKVITPGHVFTASPALASGNVRDIPLPDLFLLGVKSYDLERAVTAIRSKVRENTLILPLLNGVDIYERIRKDLDGGIVLPACLYLGTHILRPGVIDQNGGSGTVICGPDPRIPSYSGKNLKAFFREMNLDLEWRDDPYPAIWEKYIFIAAFGLLSAAAGKSLGEIMSDTGLKDRVEAIMREILAIANGKSIHLPADIISQSLDKAGTFPFEARTSYQRDIEAGRELNEGDLYGETILQEGQRLGIPTPVTEAVYRSLP